jgi:hypothetical protein
MKKYLLIPIILLITGCLPVLVGGYYYKGSTTIEAKQKFLQNFNEINLKREKEGLKPLDICAEKRNFDPDWANEDDKCKVTEKKV